MSRSGQQFTHYPPNPATQELPYYTFLPDGEDSDSDDEDEEHGHCAKAKAALRQFGFPADHRARIAIALDVSISMEEPNKFYSSGKIAELIKKAIAIAVELSPETGAEQEHSVMIFPFARGAFKPYLVSEHMKNLNTVVNKIRKDTKNVANGTDYYASVKQLREFYFKESARAVTPARSQNEPVFCIFVTDGEPVNNIKEMKREFRDSANNGIFFKLVALRGEQENLQFETLKAICKDPEAKLNNKHLIVLNDPNELTMDQLFQGYPAWAQQAHKAKILEFDPKFVLKRPSYIGASIIILGALGIILTPLVIAPFLMPGMSFLAAWAAWAVGAVVGGLAGGILGEILNCMCVSDDDAMPVANNVAVSAKRKSYPAPSAPTQQQQIWGQLQQAQYAAPPSQQPVVQTQYAPYVPPGHNVQYDPQYQPPPPYAPR